MVKKVLNLYLEGMFMRLVEVKIFNLENEYFVYIEKLKFNNNVKVVEQEYYQSFNMINEVQYYLTNILNTPEFRKNKIFINYISNDVLIETINNNLNTKINVKKELNVYYPNYHLEYSLLSGEIKLNTKNKKVVCALVKHDIMNKIKSLVSFVGKKEVYFGIDILMLQCYINKNLFLFNKKYVLLLQKNNKFYRIYQILNSKIINYLVLNEDNIEFNKIYNSIIKSIDNKIDEVIFEGNYMEYHSLVEKLFNVNVILTEYMENVKYLDERKLKYGKNKI